MEQKRGAHATISSDGLQNELVIGGVGVFGNLGSGKLIGNLGPVSEMNLLSGTAGGRTTSFPKDGPNMYWGCGVERWSMKHSLVH